MNNNSLVTVPRFEWLSEDMGLGHFFNDHLYAVDFRKIPQELRLPVIKALCIGMQPVFKKWHRKNGHISLSEAAPARAIYSSVYSYGNNSVKIFGNTFFKVKYFYLDDAIIASQHCISADPDKNIGRLDKIRKLFSQYLFLENQDEGLWYEFYDALANVVLSCSNITSDGIPISKDEASNAYWAANDKLDNVFSEVRSAVHLGAQKQDAIAELESGVKFEKYEVGTGLNLMGAASVLS